MMQRIVVLLLLLAGLAPLPVAIATVGDTAPQAAETASQAADAPPQAADAGTSQAPAGPPEAVEKNATPQGLIAMNLFAEFRDVVIGATGEGGWVTWIQVFVVVFLALLFDFIQRRIFKSLKKRLERTRNPWDDALLDALTAPISMMIWVLGIALAAAFLDFETSRRKRQS